MKWNSPWGYGFPGWHLECTAMSHKYLMKGGTLKIKEIGLRPGENLHESLDKNHKNSCDSDKYTVEEIMSFI